MIESIHSVEQVEKAGSLEKDIAKFDKWDFFLEIVINKDKINQWHENI